MLGGLAKLDEARATEGGGADVVDRLEEVERMRPGQMVDDAEDQSADRACPPVPRRAVHVQDLQCYEAASGGSRGRGARVGAGARA